MSLEKSISEVASKQKFTNLLLSPHKTINTFYETIALADGVWTAPDNLRSITFVLWGITVGDTVELNTPTTTKVFDNTRYEGMSISYAIDVNRDCDLTLPITIEVTLGLAEVDIVYTTETCS